MISVVVCSIDPAKFTAIKAMYRAAMGDEPWELIGVHDARSNAEAYNRAIPRARGEIVVFCHDDIEVLSPDFPGRLKRHLGQFDIIGVAGTSRVIRGLWVAAGPPYLFGQIVYVQPDGSLRVAIYGVLRPVVSGIEAVDGVFIAVRRPALERVRFDAATFDGFHLYDMDFSLAARSVGLSIGVACDINLLHRSLGTYDDAWRNYVDRFERKWLVNQLAPRLQMPARPAQWAAVRVDTKAEAMEVMTPDYWLTDGRI